MCFRAVNATSALAALLIYRGRIARKEKMPKYHFSQGQIHVEDRVYSPVLDQHPPDAGVILIIPPKGNQNKRFKEAMGHKGNQNHDRQEGSTIN